MTNQRLLLIAIFFLASGCATPALPPPTTPTPSMALSTPEAGQGWWSVRFKIDRPDGQTLWDTDLLIAHRILVPVLETYGTQIDLWRFHRRSNDDPAGHRFSFLFYTSGAVAEKVFRMVQDDPTVQWLLTTGRLQAVRVDAIDQNKRPRVGDTSDPKWSPVMRDNWPHFIMGVSRMWLGMIDQVSWQVAQKSPVDDGDKGVQHYQRVNDEITRIWQKEGYHALLHHLNAIYGYGPMVYWEKRLKSF